MGEVWSAVRAEDRAPVAVKVLTGEGAGRPSLRTAIGHEVAALARLDHPNVAVVHDHGVVRPDDADGSGGALVAGTPYLVMERLDADLAARPPRTWTELRVVLLGILDGLAHAH